MSAAKLPYVRVFNAVSVDGRMDLLDADLELFYGIAMGMKQDAVLSGSGTVLAAIPEVEPEKEGSTYPEAREDDERPWFVVVDSKGAVRSWHMFRAWPYFRGVAALVSRATPQEYLDYLTARGIRYFVAGDGQVDLREGLMALRNELNARQVRVDSGGRLNGALLREGLVDEVHVLIHPMMIGGMSPSSMFLAPDLGSKEGKIALELVHVRRPKPGYVWLRYKVAKPLAEP
ncbi:MAG: RibD family protein [Methanomassiliicoccales archaeon]|nr:RibD family protein [Methanomassiliicoccales archaeon]